MAWLETLGPHYGVVNTKLVTSMQVVYKGPSNYQIVAHVDTDTFVLEIHQCDADAKHALKMIAYNLRNV